MEVCSLLVASKKWGITGSELNFFFHIHHNKFKVVWQKKNRTEKNLKFIEYCKIFCTSIYISLTLNHSWTLSKKSTKNTSDTANYTALNTGHQNMTFTANVVAKFVFLPVIARYQHTYYWLDSCFLEELLYCLMLWTILFYSFLFSWEFLFGLWLANLSVTSSIQNTHMQVILNVYLRNDDFLLKVTELSSYVV